VGNGAFGASMRCQNSSVVRVAFARNTSAPKLTCRGTTVMLSAAATAGCRSLAESVMSATDVTMLSLRSGLGR
jgi:hypothetical protein